MHEGIRGQGGLLAVSEEVRVICATRHLDYLKDLVLRVNNLKEAIERERSRLDLTGAPIKEYVSISRDHDALSDGIVQLQEMIKDYCTELAEYVEQMRIAHSVLDRLSKAEYTIALTRHYLFCEQWKDVAKAMGYTHSGLMTLRRKAIAELYGYMPEEWRRTLPKAV